MKINQKDIFNDINIFFYNHEYRILEMAGVICGLLIILVANNFFVTSNIFYFIFLLGIVVGSLGFIIEFYIKTEKRKAVETEFGYFLYDLSKEYRKTKNISVALSNLSEYNFYGSVNQEIKRLSNRVSWGESFEDALVAINNNIESQVISHTLTLLTVFKNSSVSFDKVLENLSKDTQIFKSETKNKVYFSNLFYLSVVFYFIFIFVLLYINYIIGSNFLWVSTKDIMTRTYFDNFILYITLLLGAFTAYVMYAIKKGKGIVLVKYMAILFVITIVLFQIFVPRPDAEEVVVDTIKYMIKNNENRVELPNIIALKTISSKYISDKTTTNVYFVNLACEADCKKYTIIVNEPTFYYFTIEKTNDETIVYYGTTQKYKWYLMIKNITKNKKITDKHKIADTILSRGIGLMFSKKSSFNHGLVFDLERETKIGASIHMFFVFFPINVLFLDSKRKIVDIKFNLKPWQITSPKKKCRYVIELPTKYNKKYVSVGDRLSW